MRRSLRRPVGLVLMAALVALAACNVVGESKPTYFYLLEPIRPAAERPAGGAVRLALEPVDIPGYLDRQDLVTRGAGNALEVASFHRWAEPLELNASRVLAENLRLLLDDTDVVRLPARSGGYNAELQVELVRFEREAEGPVTLVARWEVLDGRSRQFLGSRRTVVQTQADGPGPAATVAAMNAAFDTLARRVAGHLQELGAAR